ncbi:FAD-binding protein, partial [Desulfocurvibacter africanus]|uniref:FAD-binding oxidoreductase n=1 Tax=Desulfocurvibacter africanus TaxID=873 RepID=UPI002FD95B89
MLTSRHEKYLRELFPGEGSLFTPEEKLIFGTDASRLSRQPWAVVRPESREQIVELLRWAEAEKMPLFTRGRATNVVGGAVPDKGGVVVSMMRMNRIKEISAE